MAFQLQLARLVANLAGHVELEGGSHEVAGQIEARAVVVKVGREIGVGVALAVVAEVVVEAFF